MLHIQETSLNNNNTPSPEDASEKTKKEGGEESSSSEDFEPRRPFVDEYGARTENNPADRGVPTLETRSERYDKKRFRRARDSYESNDFSGACEMIGWVCFWITFVVVLVVLLVFIFVMGY